MVDITLPGRLIAFIKPEEWYMNCMFIYHVTGEFNKSRPDISCVHKRIARMKQSKKIE